MRVGVELLLRRSGKVGFRLLPWPSQMTPGKLPMLCSLLSIIQPKALSSWITLPPLTPNFHGAIPNGRPSDQVAKRLKNLLMHVRTF